MNCTGKGANPGNLTPNQMWHGCRPPCGLPPFLKPGYYQEKRGNNLKPKVPLCFYLGPQRNHPTDSTRVLTESGAVVTTLVVTWIRVSSPSNPSPMQPKYSSPAEKGVTGGDMEYVHLPVPTALQEAGREVATSSPLPASSSLSSTSTASSSTPTASSPSSTPATRRRLHRTPGGSLHWCLSLVLDLRRR